MGATSFRENAALTAEPNRHAASIAVKRRFICLSINGFQVDGFRLSDSLFRGKGAVQCSLYSQRYFNANVTPLAVPMGDRGAMLSPLFMTQVNKTVKTVFIYL